MAVPCAADFRGATHVVEDESLADELALQDTLRVSRCCLRVDAGSYVVDAEREANMERGAEVGGHAGDCMRAREGCVVGSRDEDEAGGGFFFGPAGDDFA